ncbi:hypothetical protein [Novosphingobium sp.]|uniref:hypothetical protein n=1 Tax=Novosphingobium sp. TaxID=1874826 RepID=UPI0038B7A2C2
MPQGRSIASIATGSDRIACYGTGMVASSSLSPASLLARSALALAALGLVGSCASQRGDFPSLARRPAERSFAVAPATTGASSTSTALPPPGPDPLPRADALVAQAQEADSRFAAREAVSAQRIGSARNAARGSEAWAVAQIALADLESARSRATVALADLDRLLVETTISDARVADPRLAALKERHATVSALVARQDARIAGLQAMMPN